MEAILKRRKFLTALVLNKEEAMQVNRNIMINKAGGTAGKNSKLYRISLPADMVRALGVTEEDRAVILEEVNGVLTIRKAGN